METTEFKGRTFNLIGTFGGYDVLAHPTQPMEGEEGIIVLGRDVMAAYGPVLPLRTWQAAIASLGVPLFRVVVNGGSRYWTTGEDDASNRAISILMGESGAVSPLIVNDKGETIATVARTKDGASVVWQDGRVTRWRQLTWVVVAGEPVALVGTVSGIIRQV